MIHPRYEAWSIAPHYLDRMTPALARDLLVECLMTAQQSAFAARSESIVSSPDPRMLHDIVQATVRSAFAELGYDFDAPDASSCRMVVEHLVRESQSWGTPTEVIDHHTREFGKVLAALEE